MTKLIGLISLAFLALALSAQAAPKKQYEEVKVRADRDTEQSVLLMCDDTVQDGADLIIPGQRGRDFSVFMSTSITYGNEKSCGLVRAKDNKDGTWTYRIEGDEDCDVTVKFRKQKTSAVINFGSC